MRNAWLQTTAVIKALLKPACVGFFLLWTGINISAIFGGCYQSPPTIRAGVFPFRFVYELDGIRYDFKDAVVCNYTGLEGMLHRRGWETYLESGMDSITILHGENVSSVLVPERINTTIRVFLHYGHGSFYMGDPNAKLETHAKPHICYNEVYSTPEYKERREATPLTSEQAEEFFGIKILEFEFSKPIKNKFRAE